MSVLDRGPRLFDWDQHDCDANMEVQHDLPLLVDDNNDIEIVQDQNLEPDQEVETLNIDQDYPQNVNTQGRHHQRLTNLDDLEKKMSRENIDRVLFYLDMAFGHSDGLRNRALDGTDGGPQHHK